MEKGFEILWTDLALDELSETVGYLEREFSQKEIDILGDEIERISSIISQNPNIFPNSDRLQTRKAVILKFYTLYYRIMNDKVEILSFFSNRQSSKKRNYNIKTKQKASENSEALILYFGIEIPIFQIIVDVLQEHSAKTAVHYSMVIRM